MQPTFIVIGAMKAGTTALYEYLRAHPQVFMAAPKELGFFAGTDSTADAMYGRYFEGSEGADAVGEVSSDYSKAHLWPETAGRIAAQLPDVRIVYLVRHPIHRIRAEYLQLAAEGENRSFAKAVTQDEGYVLTSSYALQLEAYLAHFPREALLVLEWGQLRYNRHRTLARLYDFIGVGSGFSPPQVVANPDEEHRTTRTTAKVLQQRKAYRRLLNRSWRMRRVHLRVRTREIEAEVTPRLQEKLAARLEGDVARLRELVPGLPSWKLYP